jgi:hypothetical protein
VAAKCINGSGALRVSRRRSWSSAARVSRKRARRGSRRGLYRPRDNLLGVRAKPGRRGRGMQRGQVGFAPASGAARTEEGDDGWDPPVGDRGRGGGRAG